MKHNEIRNQVNGNRFNVFLRAAFGIAYLYFNFAAYQLIGIGGVVITSVFFLVAQFAPLIMRTFWRQRKAQLESPSEIFVEPGVENQTVRADRIRLVSEVDQKRL